MGIFHRGLGNQMQTSRYAGTEVLISAVAYQDI